MAKLTLDDLAKTAKSVTPTPTKLQKADLNVLAADLRAAHPEEAARKAEAEQQKTPELVEAAFGSFESTIEKKKAMADEMVQQAEDSAEEAKTEAEFKESFGSDESTDTPAAEERPVQNYTETEDDEDLLGSLDDEDDAEEEEYHMEPPKVATPPQPPVQKSVEVAAPIKAPATTITAGVTAISDDVLNKELSDIDEMLSDIDIDDEEENDEATRARIKNSLKNTMNPVANTIDFSKFTIQSKPVSISSVLNNMNASPMKKYADWPLLYTGINVRFEECDGLELDALQKTLQRSNEINRVIATIKFVYRHVVDANKPSFEDWCKTIRTEDFNSLFFGLFLATFSDASSCIISIVDQENCGKEDAYNVDPMRMVEIEDEDVKAKFDQLMKQQTTTKTSMQESIPYQISDNFVITYRYADLYSSFIQASTIDQKIMDKYMDMINSLAYVDQFFTIDRASQQLIPIKVKQYPNDLKKTVLTKLRTYNEILKTLTADQLNAWNGKLASLMSDSEVQYVYPEMECKVCKKMMPSRPLESVVNLLFTRAQLAQIKNS